MAPLAAVVVVVVVILLLIWINGKGSGNKTGPGVVTAPTRTNSPLATAPVVPTQNPTPVGHTPSTHPTKPMPTKHHHSTGPVVPATSNAMAPVVVLNNSRITGLAAQVASELRAKGWQINSVGNQQAVIPETTLYYGDGKRAAALHLAKQFTQIRRVRSATAAGISGYGSNLTLVVTRDWT
jgi:cytoskeletal protein RodZ